MYGNSTNRLHIYLHVLERKRKVFLSLTHQERCCFPSDNLFTFTDLDSNSDADSDYIPVIGIWNLNPILCNMKNAR